MIIIPAQVEQSMDDVAHHFLLPGDPKTFRLPDGFRHAYQKVSVEARILAGHAVVEGDHIRAAFVLEVTFVGANHGGLANQVNAKLEILSRQFLLQQVQDNAAQIAGIDSATTLPVANQEHPLVHAPSFGRCARSGCRCCS